MSLVDLVKKALGKPNYGRPHYWQIRKYPILPYGKNVLCAQHEKNGLLGLYREDGSLAFGSPHHLIQNIFYLSTGEVILDVQHKKDGLFSYYRADGSYYYHKLGFEYENLVKDCSLVDLFSKTFNCLYYMMAYNLTASTYHSDIEQVVDAFGGSLRLIIEQYKDNPDRVKQELTIMFNAIQRKVVERPQDFMDVLGCLK